MNHFNLPVSLFSLSAFDLFDELIALAAPVQKLPQSLCNRNYPPSNIGIDKDKNYFVSLATAGWDEDEISINYEDHRIVVSLTPKDKKDESKYLQVGIKRAESEIKIFVPEKYNETKIKVSYKNGILNITVPLKEESKPKKIEINKE